MIAKPNDNIYTAGRLIVEALVTLNRKEQGEAMTRAASWCTHTVTYLRVEDPRRWAEKEAEYNWWIRLEMLLDGAATAATWGLNFQYWK